MARVTTTAHLPRTLRPRLHGDQSGAVIILALAFLTIILALAVGLLGMAHTGSSSLRAYRLERHRRYAADSALQSAVQHVRQDPRLGVTPMPDDPDVPTVTPPPCAMNYTVQEDTASGGAIRVFTPGSVLNVSCSNTPGVTDSGVREFDLREKRTGGQRPREVSFVVTCAYNTVPARGTLTCGSGSNTMVLARARVRYDIDLSIVPKRPDCGPYSDAAELPVNWDSFTDNLCTASSVRAVVPKIVQWSIKGG